MKLIYSLSLSVVVALSGCAQMSGAQSGLQSNPGEGPQLVLAAAGKPLKTSPLNCPGTATSDCEVNWQALVVGQSFEDTVRQIGEGLGSTQQVYIDRVEMTTEYSSGGKLMFTDNKLVSIVLPETYLFPAPVAGG